MNSTDSHQGLQTENYAGVEKKEVILSYEVGHRTLMQAYHNTLCIYCRSDCVCRAKGHFETLGTRDVVLYVDKCDCHRILSVRVCFLTCLTTYSRGLAPRTDWRKTASRKVN
jgi:hypothetical protein